MLGLVGCRELSVDSLKANYHLQKANQKYTDEKYRAAVDEYEEALRFNPDLKSVYIYLGTAYGQMYRPMKQDERNKMYGEKAVENLTKAFEAYPDNENTINALGDIYDKLGNFEKAVEYYKKIQERDPDNPKSYYILADFYSKYNKAEEAEGMYQKRIELDPRDPEGYHYFAGYMQNRNKWNQAIEYHEKRLYALVDADIVILSNEIDKLKVDIKQVEDLVKYRDETIKKHKSLPQEEKDRLIAEANDKLQQFKPLEEMTQSLEAKEKEKEEKLGTLKDKIAAVTDEEKKKEILVTYYTIGVVCWTKSYRTPPNLMAPKERLEILDYGMKHLNFVLEIQPEHDMALSFQALIWLQKIVAEPIKNEEYRAKWKLASDLSKEIRTKRIRKEKLKEQLDAMSEVNE